MTALIGSARHLRAVVLGLAGLFGLAQGALAQTAVSGAIAGDVHWTAAQSPYVVTNDVSIVAGAHLTVDPGVTVYFAPGKNLLVSDGALSAVGTAQAPIVFSSKKVLDGLPAGRGDWGKIRFLTGTIDAATRLEQVTVEYGQGLEFVAASARVDHATLRHNAGAAITLDLASSPTGVGNSASDNGLDAVVVPAGAIQGDVTWGLRGIQYLVASGQVEVGAAPTLHSVTPNSAQVDESVDVVFDGSRLAGLSDIRFDRAGVQAVQSTPASADSAAVKLVVAPDAVSGPVAITATTDAGEVTLAAAFTIQPRQPKLLSINPTQVFVGQGATAFEVGGTALQPGTEIMLDATPLATTVVSPERATATLPDQASTGTRQISLRTPDPATPGSYFTTTSLPLLVDSAALAVTPAVTNTQVGLTPTVKVVLPFPAPVGGLVVNVSSTNPAIATVPATVTVPAGTTEANVLVTAKALGTTSIRAARTGYILGSATVVVTLPPSITVSPGIVNVAVQTSLAATLQFAPAPTQDTVVTLASNNPAVFTVAAQVTVPAGAATFPVDLTGVADGVAALTASTAGYSNGTATVRVAPKSILLPTSAIVAPGSTRTLTVALNAPAPAGGLQLALASSNSSVLSVPASVTIAEGQSSVVIAGISGVANGSATLTASASGFVGGSTAFTVRTVTIYVYPDAYSLPVGFSTAIRAQISEAAPPGGVSIDLAVDNPALGTLDTVRVDIPAGSASSPFAPPRLSALAAGTVTITGSAPGLTPFSRAITVQPPPGIRLPYTGVQVGKGMQVRGLAVYLDYATPANLTVSLVSSQPDKLSVPASIVIPAGQSSGSFDATGLALSSAPVTVTASAPGYTGTNVPMSIDVVPVLVEISGQEPTRVVGNSWDDIQLVFRTASNSWTQYAAAPTSVVFSLASANPVGIIDGFYDYPGGTRKSEFILPAGSYYTTVYAGNPTATGSYGIKAEIPGGASSNVISTQVVRPKLYFNYTSEKVARGFKLTSNSVTIARENIGGLNNSLDVYLTSSDPSKVTVPTVVTIPSGRTSVRFEVVGVAGADLGTVTIDATAAGFDSPTEKMSFELVDPVFTVEMNYGLGLVVGEDREWFAIEATNGNGLYVTALTQMSVAVSIVEPSVPGIIDGLWTGSGTSATPLTSVTIYANGSSGSGYFGAPTSEGSFRLGYQVAGGVAGVSDPIIVGPGHLTFRYQSAVTTGVSFGYSACVYVENQFGGVVYTKVPINVTPSVSDPTKVQVPASATIPANDYRACYMVAGLAPTNGTPVTLGASAPGYISPTVTVPVTVMPVTWKMYNQSTSSSWTMRGVYTAERSFYSVSLMPFIGNTVLSHAWALADTAIPLRIVEDTPAGLVDGLYASQTSTTPITSVMASNRSFYLGSAMQAGSYRVQATVPDGTVVTSSPVYVTQDFLQLSTTTAMLGVGTKLDLYTRRGANLTGDTVSLGCADTTICSTPASTVINWYQFAGYQGRFSLTGLKEGETILSATLPGLTPAQVSVVVSKPIVKVDYLPATVALGQGTTLTVRLYAPNGASLTTIPERTVTLQLSAPGIVSVPTTVTIPAGGYQASFNVSSLAKGTVTITASEPGSDPSSGSITVN